MFDNLRLCVNIFEFQKKEINSYNREELKVEKKDESTTLAVTLREKKRSESISK